MKNATMKKTPFLERRKDLRTPPPARAIVHTTETFGEICDISRGGFSLKYFETGEPLKTHDHVDIVMGGLSLSNLAVTVAWQQRTTESDLDSLPMSQVGFKFTSLTPLQQTILDFFLSNKAAGTA